MKRADALKDIIVKKNERIALAKQQISQETLRSKILTLGPTLPFLEAISKPHTFSLIAEIKKASPSGGVICQDFNPVQIARYYREAGAAAISVLTEEDFFQGSVSYLSDVRGAVSDIPLLRKDFIFEPYQIYESRAFGADAVLLIADLLSKEKIQELVILAQGLGLECLVEVHEEKELKKILSLKIPLSGVPQERAAKKVPGRAAHKEIPFALGINNRDLHSLEVDFKTTERLFPLIPKGRVIVVESGIKSYQDTLFLKILGVNAILVGEAILRSPHIVSTIQELMGW
ncbi:MAG: indole-3-glycerol phosphate synthase TrpC [Candidatus Omnitrophica bacterium]|nr:indole-3-glycerol phosphate synthase TrpC [Candidatus Omnitrophota bacterium]